MSKKSTQIALGGMFSALSVTMMFMTGLIPFATYAIPMLAGAMLIPVLVELGTGSALMVYASVSFLSLFVVVDKEAAMMFIVFFGYYPIVKHKLEQIPLRTLEYLIKLVLFNGAVIAGFSFLIYVLGMEEMLAEMSDLGKYAAIVMLGIGNVVFLIYDFALTRYYTLYVNWFKPHFLRR